MSTPTPVHTPAALEITPDGPFDLDASSAFLEGFTPAGRPDAAEAPGALRLSFVTEGSWSPAGVLVGRGPNGTVRIEAHASGSAPPEAVLAQARRILSLDVAASGLWPVAAADPVVAELLTARPGLRPVLFGSAYEAACWAVLSQRLQIVQAARIKRRIAERFGAVVSVAGRELRCFPDPYTLLDTPQLPGVPEVKVRRLHAVALAAVSGELDAAPLRALDPAEALTRLRRLPGIGPFSADLILIRGAGHPDVFATGERRLHEEMRARYGRPDASPADLERIAERWRPLRSWVTFLLRASRAQRTGELARPPAAPAG